MTIKFKQKNEILYGELRIGDIFTHGGYVYMVTDQPEEGTKGELKSVNLSNGNMEVFGSKVVITIFSNATLILE